MGRYIKSFQNNTEIQEAIDNGNLLKPYVAYNNSSATLDYNTKTITALLSISPSSLSGITSGGSAYSVAVSSNTNWTITNNLAWVSLSSNSGTGNGSVTVTVSANNGSSRVGNIVFKTVDNTVSVYLYLQQEAYSEPSYADIPLTIQFLSGGTWVMPDPEYDNKFEGLEYSYNGGEWTSTYLDESQMEIISGFTFNSGDTIAFRKEEGSDANKIFTEDVDDGSPYLTVPFNVYGNLYSLWADRDSYSSIDILEDVSFEHMFENTNVVDASNLALPASILADYCYRRMFAGCTALTAAPELPANDLADGCYESMFDGCTSLVKSPDLPALDLRQSCYSGMFYGCTSLSSVTMGAVDISSEGCLDSWLENVASEGVIYKADELCITCKRWDDEREEEVYGCYTEVDEGEYSCEDCGEDTPCEDGLEVNSSSGIPEGWRIGIPESDDE